MRLVLIGPPGSGKGTQAALLHERKGLIEIGTGDILRAAIARGGEAGRLVEPYLKKGLLVPDEMVNALVEDLFLGDDAPQRFVMDGYPRTLAQAEAFDKILQKAGSKLDKVIYFEIEDEEVFRRMMSRRRVDDTAATIRKRLQVYHENTDRIIEYYHKHGLVLMLSAKDEVETIYRSIITQISAA